MTKITRNAPCSCGSGKKYKKCCLEKDLRERPSTSVIPQPPAGQSLDPARPPILPPYVLAKIFEESEQFETLKRREPERARLLWTPSRVAALETEEILTRLRELGVDPSREAYLELARDRTSAWELSRIWRQEIRKRLSSHENDFLGIAACELWKRHCPQRPSIEMLDDWMQEGYDFMMNGNGAQACDCWWPLWEIIRSRLGPEMRTCENASVVFEGTQALYNWVQDFALELHNAALDSSRYADTGVRLCEEVLTQFPDEDALFHLNFRADLGQFCYMAARPEEGERILLDLIRDHPDSAAGYARLADILAYGGRRDEGPIDPQRAQTLLESALARPVGDAVQYDLEARLNDLRNAAAGRRGA